VKSKGPFSAACLMGLLVLAGSGAFAADTQPAPAASASQPKPVTNQAAKPRTEPANDQLILDSTVVTGNRGLPKVMYIVPWKKAELSDLPLQPFNTLIDETLAPVDREEFRREVDYYRVISDKDRASKDRAIVAPSASGPATPAADRK